MSTLYDVLILGGGPAGLTAAIYNARADLNVLVIAGNPAGGQLMLTTEVENFPGFINGILGPDLINNTREQAKRFNTKIVDENVVSVGGSPVTNFIVKTDANNEYTGKCVIIATGASAKWLNLPNEQRLRGYGVSACATCDGFFFKNKEIAVVGGGDASMEEATYLTKFASKVYILARNDQGALRASKIMQERALSNPKIQVIYNTEVVDVLGDKSVSGLKLLNSKTNEESELLVQGVFVAIGHQPNTDFLKDFVELDQVGYVVVKNNTRTSVDGVFVAGDVADFRYRQAITAAGLGCMASLDAEKYLAGH